MNTGRIILSWRPWPHRRTVWSPKPSEHCEDTNDRPRTFSDAHRRLLEEMRSAPQQGWAGQALHACLEHLAVSTEAWGVDVHEAWVEDEWTFCVVYEYAYFDGRLGLRRTALDAQHPGRFCNMYGENRSDAPEPTRYGQDVADFDIAEPLGTVADRLRWAPDGFSWWGSIGVT